VTVTPNDYVMRDDDREVPLLWVASLLDRLDGIPLPDTTDETLARLGVTGRSRLVRSWGHNDETGVHWLLTRGGTPVHTDRAYLRYTHQIVLRNDGTRIRGHPRFDPEDEADWPPPLAPGAFYCLDTHSPHQGAPDPRLPQEPARVKVVVAVDRDHPMRPEEAYPLLHTYLHRQLTDDPMTTRPPRWKEHA
jgi:hypothetical protein